MLKIASYVSLLLVCVSLSAGCMKVEAKAPESISWGSPPPPTTIARANPDSKADLLRENQQLRERVAWLEEQNRHLAQKCQNLDRQSGEIRADMAKIAS